MGEGLQTLLGGGQIYVGCIRERMGMGCEGILLKFLGKGKILFFGLIDGE